MSEKGWRAFLVAEGLEDWAVLHGGPTAVFTTETLIVDKPIDSEKVLIQEGAF